MNTWLTGIAADPGSDWKPALDVLSLSINDPKQKEASKGRLIDIWSAIYNPAWGYGKHRNNCWDTFYVVRPVHDRKDAPLYVVLHSAGHNHWTALQAGFRKTEEGEYNDHGLYHTPDDFYGLYISGDSWWGRDPFADSKEDIETNDSPVEKRVLETVKWVVANYGIDPNRVYLCGISMGGSGSLGIGMRHGEVFASMMVWVPAGTSHFERRLFVGKQIPAGLPIPDPPVLLNMSAQNDSWSKGQDILIKAAADRKYALVMGWGLFGHTGDTRLYYKNCGEIMNFPWLEIRKNQAYPVFTGATSDQKNPWLNPSDAAPQGQINAYFRWKNVEDSSAAFSMQVWLAKPDAKNGVPETAPREATADVTFRRLQGFKASPDEDCRWALLRDGKQVASGIIRPDAAGLLTISKVAITAEPVTMQLSIK